MQTLVLVEPFRAVFYAPYYVALEGGHFTHRGIRMQLETAGTPDAAAGRLLDGSADLAWSGPMRPMLERSRDAASPLRSFGAAVMRDPFLLLGMGARPGFQMADLATLRVAIPSEVPTPWWCLMHDLRQAGVDPATCPGHVRMPMPEGASALREGRVDAVMLFEPHAAALEEAGATVWYAAADRGLTAYSALYAVTPRIAQKHAAFTAVVQGLGAALDWLRAATPAEIAAVLAPRFAEMPQAHLLRAIGRYQRLGLWENTTHLPRAALDGLAAAMISSGAMTHHPGYESCIDLSLDLVGPG
ncbi:ABC transporter substrate-binding protein [Falsiroseomonas tokyonensis]|uniref:ABC transporter substrate-binding protein n=1 Tax=Falsiroseomonas tokyonensis TaxID=430521 RepID=A0ABV7BM76_9PROT|nr:ABC transporter substrate-binding protein [Falsiroseomonas tokyonensis]MBU8536660.1 ABC transporter substrate-binding protein [Falsiroseomonas tokyonensis]